MSALSCTGLAENFLFRIEPVLERIPLSIPSFTVELIRPVQDDALPVLNVRRLGRIVALVRFGKGCVLARAVVPFGC